MQKIPNFTIAAIRELLKTKSSVVITSHHNPDGDAIGSILGLYFTLKDFGVDAKLVIPNDIPDFLTWLPCSDKIVRFSKQKKQAKKIISEADIIFSLDYNDPGRLEKMANEFTNSNATKILIDHHPDPEDCFTHYISFVDVGSTAEIVYEFAIQLLEKVDISKNTAISLFTGIMTDTGSFSYGCNYPRVFEVVANLVKNGVDIEYIQNKVYNTFSESRMKLIGYALSNRMKVFPEYKSAYISLTRDELNSFGYKPGDTEGLVNYPLSIDGIIFSSLFIENTDFIKVSLRSRGEFPANKISEDNFSGGGHRNAAGGKSFTSLEETESLFERILEKHKNELNK